MILAALLCAAIGSGPAIVECPVPGSQTIEVQALVRLPQLDARELGVVRVLIASLTAGTDDLTSSDLRSMTSYVGPPIRCMAMPDHLRIAFSMPKGNLDAAGRVLDAVLRQANFPEDAVRDLIETMPYRQRSSWSETLDPRTPRFDKVSRESVVALYAHLFRPENVVVGVGGAIEAGEAKKALSDRFADWLPGTDRYPKYHSADFPKSMTERKRPITTLELECPEVNLAGDGFPAALLASAAIGVGKGATVFRAIREGLNLSYKQDAFLWPSDKGVRLRIVVTMASREDEGALGGKVRDAILRDIEGWSEIDRQRAWTVLQEGFRGGAFMTPLWLKADRPLDAGIDDRTLLAAYWRLKTGEPFDQASLLKAAGAVNLADLKEAAKRAVSGAQIRLIAGR